MKFINTPKHIGIILDGNRRFARRLMIKPWKGHEWGAEKIEKFLEWCKELKVKEVTIYAFSIENFNRPKKEFDYLMNLFKKECHRLLNDKRVEEDKVKINFIGHIHLFPKDLRQLMKKVMEKTKRCSRYKVNFAMAYGGRAELIDAFKKIAEKVKKGELSPTKITEKEIEKHLYISSEPDLIIRTSGEHRTSGFLPWQSTYSELYFCKKMWPEFTKRDFMKAINSYTDRERRFGR